MDSSKALQEEVDNLKRSNASLKAELSKAHEEMHTLKFGSTHTDTGMSLFQRIRDVEGERGQLVQQLLGQDASNPIAKQLLEKDAAVNHLLSHENSHRETFVKKPVVDGSIYRIYHNVVKEQEQSAKLPFAMEYIHSETIKRGGFFEVRIDDVGEVSENIKRFDIGIGVINDKYSGGNRKEFGCDIGYLSNNFRVLHLDGGDKTEMLECPDSVLIAGDVIRCEIGDDGVIVTKNQKRSTRRQYIYNEPDEYQIFIGLNNYYGKVTLACNKSFHKKADEFLQVFPKDDLRIYITTMNEGSPNYANGVGKGGKALLQDGTLARKIRENGRRIINYEPGLESSIYDVKVGANFTLEDVFYGSLHRNRFTFGGNLITVSRRGPDHYSVLIESLLSGVKERFNGSDADWVQQRDELLSNGEKYVIDLPTPHGMIQTNDLLIAGTKCKTIANMVYGTLVHKIEDTKNTPALILLGGDRSQSVGSISGALRAYEDLCIVYFDAHFDFRDPNATQYPISHGSPLFLLLQGHVREAAQEWENANEAYKSKYPETKSAIQFLKSTPNGRQYWESLLTPSDGYRGFNWLQDTAHINPHRLAFFGCRQTRWEAGSSLGSPLVGLFTHLLHLQECMYPEPRIREEGVSKLFGLAMEQFRNTFPKEYLDKKDAEQPNGEKWIPPIMVSWDADSIDPNDLPCTIFQEANGLTAEECLAFSDEIALTKKLVLFETVEFNPDLWNGYRDEPVMWTINEFESGPYLREPREPTDKNQHRLDLQGSTALLQNMVLKAFDKTPQDMRH